MTNFGRYDLQEIVGQGAFGVVYRATDRVLNRVVAVKVLHPQLSLDSTFVQQFTREAQIVATFDHANIITIHDVGEEQGRYYLVMKYLSGGSLAAMIKRAPLPYTRAQVILAQVAAGLQQVHAKGWVHRDLKPENIILDGEGRAVVTDFGLVRVPTGSSAGASSTGSAGVGTPHYRAPELWRGRPPASPATDVYALGCILYEMLTGKVLFGGNTFEEIITHHLIDEPNVGPTWPPAGAPAELVDFLNQALAKDPARRFPNAAAFAKALQAVPAEQARKVTQNPAPLPPAQQQGPISPPTARNQPAPEAPKKGLLDRLFGQREKPAPQPSRQTARSNTPAALSVRKIAEWKKTERALVRFVPGSELLGVAGYHSVDLYDCTNFEPVRQIGPGLLIKTHLCFSPDGKLASVSWQDRIPVLRTWLVASGEELPPRQVTFGSDYYDLAYSPDGALIASGVGQEGLALYNIADCDLVRKIGSNIIYSINFSPDGSLVAVTTGYSGRIGPVEIWRVADGVQVRSFSTDVCIAQTDARFSPNGKFLAVGARDQSVHLWRVADGSELPPVQCHSDDVTAIAFSPDGKLLASGSDDSTIKLWSLDQQRQVYDFGENLGEIRSLDFSPDGSMLAAGADDGMVRVWSLAWS